MTRLNVEFFVIIILHACCGFLYLSLSDNTIFSKSYTAFLCSIKMQA